MVSDFQSSTVALKYVLVYHSFHLTMAILIEKCQCDFSSINLVCSLLTLLSIEWASQYVLAYLETNEVEYIANKYLEVIANKS